MAEPISLTFPDGSRARVPRRHDARRGRASISPSLAKAAISARVDGAALGPPVAHRAATPASRSRPSKDDEGLELIRHDLAHVMARAVQELWPDVKVTIGPVTETGWFYDFDRAEPFTPEDLGAIEAEMRRIIAAARPGPDRGLGPRPRHRALRGGRRALQGRADRRASPRAQPIRMYWHGDWQDLCRGPHLQNTGQLPADAFKLMGVSGAYWFGDVDRAAAPAHHRRRLPQPRRPQGASHHARGGRQARPPPPRARDGALPPPGGGAGDGVLAPERLDDLAHARGLHGPPPAPRPATGRSARPRSSTACSGRSRGHWENYRENMFLVEVDEEGAKEKRVNALKPMNCPCHVQVYNQGLKSYRDLPLRLAEFGACHRYESSGSHARPHARARLHPGRRPHLLHRGPDRGRVRAASSTLLSVGLPRPRLRAASRSSSPPGPRCASARTRSGTRSRARWRTAIRKAGNDFDARTPATAPSTGPSSTSC